MFKRIKRISERLKSNQDAASSASAAPAAPAFTLHSPLVRELALRVGSGQPAALVQQISQAAVEEVGADAVAPSISVDRYFVIGLSRTAPSILVDRYFVVGLSLSHLNWRQLNVLCKMWDLFRYGLGGYFRQLRLPSPAHRARAPSCCSKSGSYSAAM